MATPSLIEKLRKILAYTTSPNEHEASTAMAMLNQLLTQHNLSIVDLEKKGAAAARVHESGHDLGKAAFKWKLDLAEAIADHYYCYAIVDRHAKTVVFVGRPDNVESLRMLYQWLIDQIRRIASDERRLHCTANPDDHIDPLRWQVQFGVGIVPRLRTRLNELKKRQSDDAATTAMVIHHSAEVSDYLEEKYGYRRDGQYTKYEAKWREEAKQERERLARLKETDIEAYYQERPWERPETPEQVAAREQREAAERKKEEARARRRTGPAWRPRSAEQVRRDEQGYTARQAGRESADRVNLQPFIEGRTTNPNRVKGKE